MLIMLLKFSAERGGGEMMADNVNRDAGKLNLVHRIFTTRFNRLSNFLGKYIILFVFSFCCRNRDNKISYRRWRIFTIQQAALKKTNNMFNPIFILTQCSNKQSRSKALRSKV